MAVRRISTAIFCIGLVILTTALNLPPPPTLLQPSALPTPSTLPNIPLYSPPLNTTNTNTTDTTSALLFDISFLTKNTDDAGSDGSSAARAKCNGDMLGTGLNVDSCWDALTQIEADDTGISFGRRSTGFWDVQLPRRFLSCKWLWYWGYSEEWDAGS